MEEEDFLISARNLWEKDRILYNQMLNEKKKQWNEMVQEKRRYEKMERERRKENNEYSLRLHFSQLEEKINERHSKCEKRHDQILNHKVCSNFFIAVNLLKNNQNSIYVQYNYKL